ncbi:MAG: hypothetical protein Q9162_006973 [Coniocarpon cinnabarinum]
MTDQSGTSGGSQRRTGGLRSLRPRTNRKKGEAAGIEAEAAASSPPTDLLSRLSIGSRRSEPSAQGGEEAETESAPGRSGSPRGLRSLFRRQRDRGKGRKVSPTPSQRLSDSDNPAHQFNYLSMMEISGPRLRLKSETTAVGKSETSTNYDLPMGINFKHISELANPPSAHLSKRSKNLLSNMLVGALPDHDSLIDLEGNVQWRSEHTFSGENNESRRPDLILEYNHRTILCIEYKGPNCINLKELSDAQASGPLDVKNKMGRTRPGDLFEPGLGLDNDSLFRKKSIHESMRNLVRQSVNYGPCVEEARFIAFYDYTHLLLLEVPKNSPRKEVLNAYVVTESDHDKSTPRLPHQSPENHVAGE